MLKGVLNHPPGVHDVGDSSHAQAKGTVSVIESDDLPSRIGDQQERQPQSLPERAVSIRRVRADSHRKRPRCIDGFIRVPEATRLPGSTLREVLRVEEEDHGSSPGLRQGERRAIVEATHEVRSARSLS